MEKYRVCYIYVLKKQNTHDIFESPYPQIFLRQIILADNSVQDGLL